MLRPSLNRQPSQFTRVVQQFVNSGELPDVGSREPSLELGAALSDPLLEMGAQSPHPLRVRCHSTA